MLAAAAGALALIACSGRPHDSARAKADPMTETAKPHRKPNRLIREKSPYLLQHAYNPVDWRPWGDDAFAEARSTGKLVFLDAFHPG